MDTFTVIDILLTLTPPFIYSVTAAMIASEFVKAIKWKKGVDSEEHDRIVQVNEYLNKELAKQRTPSLEVTIPCPRKMYRGTPYDDSRLF